MNCRLRSPVLVRLLISAGGGTAQGRQWEAPAGWVISDLRVIVYGASAGSGVRWSATVGVNDETDDPALNPAEPDALGIVRNAALAFEPEPSPGSGAEPQTYEWIEIESARLSAIQLSAPGSIFADVLLTAAVVLVPDPC